MEKDEALRAKKKFNPMSEKIQKVKLESIRDVFATFLYWAYSPIYLFWSKMIYMITEFSTIAKG